MARTYNYDNLGNVIDQYPVEYILIEEDNKHDFEQSVVNKMRDGYELVGGVSRTEVSLGFNGNRVCYCQAAKKRHY